jgi:hypothetical protein
MKAELLRDMGVHPARVKKGESHVKKAGTIIVDPDAWKLVRIGVAKPADKECAERAGVSIEQIEAQGKLYDKIGIASEDWDAFDQGLMVGYDPNGKKNATWLPGPKFTEGAEKAYYESRAEEDEDDDE